MHGKNNLNKAIDLLDDKLYFLNENKFNVEDKERTAA